LRLSHRAAAEEIPRRPVTRDPLANCDFGTPYWWLTVDRAALPTSGLPDRADIAIVGSGYTGVSAALALARAGRSVVVIDSQRIGEGASTRNAGMATVTLKTSPAELARKLGQETAAAIFREALGAAPALAALIEREKISCGYRKTGVYLAAARPSHYDALARSGEALAAFGIVTEMVPAARQQEEFGALGYFGGRLQPDVGALNPAQYHFGLAQRCAEAGVTFVERVQATLLDRNISGWHVHTSAGVIDAGELIIATNGYTGALVPWLRRRLVPVGSHMIVTEPLPPDHVAALIPRGRLVLDSKKMLNYARLTPEGDRLIFGGRVNLRPIDPRESARLLHRALVERFPALADVAITHSWGGNVAFTFDYLPHIGSHDGLHYALGYNAQGLAMATHFGQLLAQRILAPDKTQSAFPDREFPTRPFYTGRPWFLPLLGEWYRFQDCRR
jgi:glycine/D-amino acid oxidase-like deaminating enzyme